ncbi:MAG: TIGR02147 family protein [Bdellovibrionota bacterium]
MAVIFQHPTVSSFLNSTFSEIQARRPGYSARAWAKQLGFTSHAPLLAILKGQRHLPKRHLPGVAKGLKLKSKESEYLETLLDLERSRNPEQRGGYLARLDRLRPSRFETQILEIANKKYFENPLHAIVRTLMGRADFSSTPERIRQSLRIESSVTEIGEVIERLQLLGLAKLDNGRLVKSVPHVRNKLDVPSHAVQSYHRRVAALAGEEVGRQSVDRREYSGFAMNVKPGSLPEAKKRIRDFVASFIDEFESVDGKTNETYQFNLQYFALSAESDSGETKV